MWYCFILPLSHSSCRNPCVIHSFSSTLRGIYGIIVCCRRMYKTNVRLCPISHFVPRFLLWFFEEPNPCLPRSFDPRISSPQIYWPCRGGTPTALTADQLEYLLGELTKPLDFWWRELTIEATGDLDPDKIAASWSDSPVNCLLPDLESLAQKIGRSHQEQISAIHRSSGSWLFW